MTAIVAEPWGTLADGRPVHRFVLQDGPCRVEVSDLGACLLAWHTPDRRGAMADVLLGHDTAAGYLQSDAHLGGLIGPYANRIVDARFTLDGRNYCLAPNDGPHLLHSGAACLDRHLWQADIAASHLRLHTLSPQTDGFPGRLRIELTYRFDAAQGLTIDYRACSDAPTPLNLTSHPYFDLSGGQGIRAHRIWIDAARYLRIDARQAPIGYAPVAGSAFDFRVPASLDERLAQDCAQLVYAGGGIDHYFALDREAARLPRQDSHALLCLAARAWDPGSGRALSVWTTERGVQCYTGNHLRDEPGKQGRVYQAHDGLCFEAQARPNQINDADAEGVVLRPGAVYRQRTRYQLTIEDCPLEPCDAGDA